MLLLQQQRLPAAMHAALGRCSCSSSSSSGRSGRSGMSSGRPPLALPRTRRAASVAQSLSSASLPISQLCKYYHQVQTPASANKRYSLCVLDFVNEAVEAYALGCNEAQLEAEMEVLLAQTHEADKLGEGFDKADCVACTMLVWATLMVSPKGVRRWAKEAAVSPKTMDSWRGFVEQIVNAYFDKRMAWYPLDRLSMEINASQDRAEAPDRVAERARICFTTLEKVFPQWPQDDL